MQGNKLNSIKSQLIVSFASVAFGASLLVLVSYFFFKADTNSKSGQVTWQQLYPWALALENQLQEANHLTQQYLSSQDPAISAKQQALWADRIPHTLQQYDSLTGGTDQLRGILRSIKTEINNISSLQQESMSKVLGRQAYQLSLNFNDYSSPNPDTIILTDLQRWAVRNAAVTVDRSLEQNYQEALSQNLAQLAQLLYIELPVALSGQPVEALDITEEERAQPKLVAARLLHEEAAGTSSFFGENAYLLLLAVLVLVFLGVVFLVYYLLQKKILRSVGLVHTQVKALSEGNLPQTSDQTDDELNVILEEIRALTEDLRNVKNFAMAVGKGQFDNDIAVFNNEGDIGTSLAEMRDSLKNVADQDKKRNWVNEGMAKFADILRNNSDNISRLCDQIIINLVKYLEANQGAIFLINDDDTENPYMLLQSTYAYERKKYIERQIKSGEGLVGTVWNEAESIYMVDIPQTYINISSGLGHSRPDCLLIVPLKVNEDVFGVLEIASFKKLEEHQVDFVENIAESIAASIANVRTNERTRALLEESQQMTEEMKSQEEEMRQNMEELQATQEEMQRKAHETEELLNNSQQQQEEFKVKSEELAEQERKLRQSQHDIIAIMEGVPDLILVTSLEGQIEDLNSTAMEELSGAGTEPDQNISSLLPALDLEQLTKQEYFYTTDHTGKRFNIFVGTIEKMGGERLLFCLRPEEAAPVGTEAGAGFKEELLKREAALMERLRDLEAKLKERQ